MRIELTIEVAKKLLVLLAIHYVTMRHIGIISSYFPSVIYPIYGIILNSANFVCKELNGF